MSSTATSSTAPKMTRSFDDTTRRAGNLPGCAPHMPGNEATVTYNAKADQWAADCEAAGWAQHWGDVAAHARAQGDASWQAGMALVLSAWALLGMVGVLV